MQEYKKSFEKIELFLKEQERQKRRGLNNYNILTAVLNKHDEVRLHSRMLFSLLDPSGAHYQTTLFLEKFLKTLRREDFFFNLQNCSVYKEYKNIDLYITDGSRHIIIENKIYASDQKNQIKRYIKTIQNENPELEADDVLVLYLTIDKRVPSTYSLAELQIQEGYLKNSAENVALFDAISYKDEITQWLVASLYEVQNITNLNEALRQYMDVVAMINNQYKEKVMSLAEYIKENESIYKMAVALQKELPKTRKNAIDAFFSDMIVSLQENLGEEWCVEIVGDLAKRYSFPLRIYKHEWIGAKKANLLFGFEFNQHNYFDGYFGIVRQSDKVDIKNNILQSFENELASLPLELNATSWWLYWEWLPDVEGIDDFSEYILFNQNARKDFLGSLQRIIKIFELDTKLMSKINAYLNQKK